jgi:hypothetical protein
MLLTWPARCQPRMPSVSILDRLSRPGRFARGSWLRLPLKLEVRSRARWMHSAPGSSCREQSFFNSMQTFPRRLGQGRVGANNVSDHLPGREVQRALRCGTHRQRDGALRAETDALGGRFLARPHSCRLSEQEYRNRFLSGLELPTTAKTIQVVQRSRLRFVSNALHDTFSKALPTAQVCRRIPVSAGEPRFALARSGSHRALYCHGG